MNEERRRRRETENTMKIMLFILESITKFQKFLLLISLTVFEDYS